jgi:hypothetical protein
MRGGLSGKRASLATWAASAGLGASGTAMVATCGGFPGACDWTLGAMGRGAASGNRGGAGGGAALAGIAGIGECLQLIVHKATGLF